MTESRQRPVTMREFRVIVQTGIVDGFESWYGPWVSRRASYVVAWLIVRYTSLSANAVTIAMVACGLVGVACFASPDLRVRAVAVVLLHMWLLLDAVDGEVARGRGTTSKAGIYLDALSHYAVNPGLLWAMVVANPAMDNRVGWMLSTAAFAVGVLSKAAESAAAEVSARVRKSELDPRYAVAPAREAWSQPIFAVDVPRTGAVAWAKRLGLTDPATCVVVLTLATLLQGLTSGAPDRFAESALLGLATGLLTAATLARGLYIAVKNVGAMSRGRGDVA